MSASWHCFHLHPLEYLAWGGQVLDLVDYFNSKSHGPLLNMKVLEMLS